MPLRIHITRDFDQMSQVAARLVEADMAGKLAAKDHYNLGLATGNSPTGLYKHLAKSFNADNLDSRRVRSFNLDEYVGLPGENPQQRMLHPESYSHFMIAELFGLLRTPLAETTVPWGSLIDQHKLEAELRASPGLYEEQGINNGRALVISSRATGLLGSIKSDILDAYEEKIKRAGGIDLHVIGVGGRGHVAFHESGIPFGNNRMLLVRLDDNTVENAVMDGHFPSVEESPRFAVSMGAELIFQARTIVLTANGARKTAPIAESILGPVTCENPLSYAQQYAAAGGEMNYVLDEEAARDLLASRSAAQAKDCEFLDLRDEPYRRVQELAFARDPESNRLV